MINFFNFEKNCLHTGTGCYQAFVWTFDFDHDYNLEDLCNDEYFSRDVNPQLPFPYDRTHHKEGVSKVFDALTTEVSRKLLHEVVTLSGEEHTYFKSRWMWGPSELINSTHISSRIVKDQPGFKLSPHVDNGFIVGNVILNLVDNDCGTTFQDFKSETPAFVASGKKNTGIFFLNGPGALHSITNNSTNTRYTLASSWQLRKAK